MSGSTEWERKLVPLKFQVSYRTIGSIKLPLTCRSAGVLESPLARDELPYSPPSLEIGTCGYVTWSQPVTERLPTLRRCGTLLVYTARHYNRYFVNLSGDYGAYLGKFSSKSRSTLKRKLRKFAELSGGVIDWRTYRGPQEIKEFFEVAAPLSRITYQDRLFGHGLPSDPRDRELAAQLAMQDNVRAYLLFMAKKPIAYLFCPILDGALIYDKLGYDPKFSSISPGTVLQALVIEALFEERKHRLLDFTEGEGEHKAFFATHHQLCADIFVMDRRAWIAVAVSTHVLFSTAVTRLQHAMARLGLLAIARRLLRA